MSDNQQIIDETIEKYEQYINPAVAKLFRFMGLSTIEWEAQGNVIRDIDGKEYIDCLGGYGVFSLGHRHPKVVEAVKRQLDLMPMSSKVLFDKPMADLAALMAEITPGDLTYSFFVNSGTEAVEGSLKLAKVHTGRNKIIATVNSFHGKTLGALSATGRDLFRDPFQPLLTGFSHVPFGDIDALRQAVDEETAAVILEPVQGEGGIIVPPVGYLSAVRDICDKTGALLICDEVQSGLGRTGKMFAVEHYGVIPDIITTAKALGGGVMPIGAFTARPAIWDKYITSPFLHTSTFGGNPLACAAAIAAINVIKEEGLVAKAEQSGTYFIGKLTELAHTYPEVVKEVRGQGLMIGVELTKEGIGGLILSEMIDKGVLIAYTLNNPKVIRIEPPLIIEQQQIDYVIAALADALAKAQDMLEDL
ncbi:acetylornithine/succinylornithine family transaminase [Sporomusa sphaeroides]|uniref:Putrescine aminotransferase n=2 Tax=Sporomusa TaxID=2375 RepID=A0ABM9W3W8_9FIRM|nr:acetylornithine/succinylornithine family transaminase [Sporomusa sphaeroides]OLS58634.1 putrescine aminotransferase [Sporomusa sphaeroides DSM 2875]CVK19856.1 Putrescine aminotransferase [Sporomusa sphaeroides DSM 2875]SCM79969.1 putrescine:2-oxoglutaric acid aminotransferase, PLP-dependent [uncultured Sporomusa sp.]